MDNDLYKLNLDDKIDKSLKILEQGEKEFSKISLGFTGGKDSLVTLDLAAQVFQDLVLVFVDTGQHFEDVYDFVEWVSNERNFDVFYAKNDNLLENATGTNQVNKKNLSEKNKEELDKAGFGDFFIGKDRGPCCHLLKTVPFKSAIKKLNVDAHINGIRWDEQESRSNEDYFSEREGHTRLHPILHWSEEDVWSYIEKKKLNYNPLYDKGYRSIGCKPCTNIVKKDTNNERSGRAQDKEKVMSRLRDLGYM